MKAVIMAGGEGTRLRPLTSLRPKPMVPIMNQPVMEHILGLVNHHSIDEAVATLAFMPQVIKDYFGDGEEWGMELAYALEETPLGTAGSVKNAEKLIGDDTFVVISGDALTDIDLAEVIAFHKDRGGPVTIALKSVPDPLEFGVVITDERGRIERFLEKPSWGQVFSDTINTGIYVLEPEIFAHMPVGTPFDFSSELFPLLMERGFDLYGCVVDGYWCDVGSYDSYVQAHRDILDGNAMIYVPGVRATDGLWVGEGAEIHPDAEVLDKVVIGQNVTVRAGARLGEYTVLGDNCVIGTGATVSHSILWSDTFVGKQATVSGSVLCRKVDVRARASVAMGSVIGDETTIGQGAHVGTDVQIYPYKRVEPAATVNESIIWESTGVRSLFGERGISGLVGVDITPELALKVAQAFGSLLPKGSHVVVSRDATRAARMLKRAMVAGLNSAGCNVRDLRVASPAVNRFTARETRCVGGLHVAVSPLDPQIFEIQFYDRTGQDLDSNSEKKIERLYFRGEFRRAFLDEVGDIIYPPRALEYYAAGLDKALEGEGYSDRWLKVVADLAFGVTSIVLPQVATGWHLNLTTLNPFIDAERTTGSGEDQTDSYLQLRHVVDVLRADLGVRFDANGEKVTLMTPAGRVLDGDTALHAVVDLWCRTDDSGRPIAVNLGASRVVEQIAARTGHTVLRPGTSRRALSALTEANSVGMAGSALGGYMFADFLAAFDGIMTVGIITRMLATTGESLDDVVERLPDFHKGEIDILCPVNRKGAVMRAVTEAAAGMEPNLTEGVLVTRANGWALVLPHGSQPLVHVRAEGDTEADLEAILREWTAVVESAIGAD